MARQRWREGDFVKIPLGDEGHSYGRVIRFGLIAFYDVRTKQNLGIEVISACPVAFTISVSKDAITKNRWEIIGSKPLEPHLQVPIEAFRQDAISGRFSIHTETADDYWERPATREECRNLERDAVWDYDHVEERLTDHFNGVPSALVERMKPR